jgi:hypothetical protein
MAIDPALFDMMNGVTNSKKKELPMTTPKLNDPYSVAIEKSIQEEVDIMLANQDPNQKKFLPLKTHRAKLEQELRQSIDLSEFGDHVTIAINILIKEGDK